MTTISKLVTTNTKGRNFNLSFDPLTLVVGGNFVGKTTVLDSIRLALMGKLPEAAKNADIFRMSSGSKMSIALHLSDDIVIARDFWQEGESVRSSGTDAVEYVTPLLNSAEYFGLTAGERLAYIAARVSGAEQKDSKGIMVELMRQWMDAEIDVHSEGVEALRAKLASELAKGGLQDALNRLLDKKSKGFTLPERFAHWNAVVKDRVGAVRTLAELKNREGECSAETLGEIREQVAEVQGNLAEAIERKGKFQQAKESSEKTAERRKKLTEWLAKPKGALARMAADYCGELKKLKAKYDEACVEGPNTASMQPALDELREKMNAAHRACEQVDAAITDLKKQIADLEHLESCPTCRAKKKGWKDVVSTDLNQRLSAEQQRLIYKEEELSVATTAFNSMKSALEKRIQQESAEKSIEESMATARNLAEQNERGDAEEKRQIAHFTEELNNLKAQDFDPDDLAGAEGDVKRLSEDLRAAQTRLDVAVRLQQQIASAVEAQEEHETATKILEAVKIAGMFLKDKQQAGTDAIIGGLLETVNFFTKDIMVAPLALHESEIGYFTPSGRFVQHDTFSGLEKLLTYCAMGCALSTKGKLRIALLDELGNLTTSMRHAFLFRVRQAVAAGILDQALGVIPLDPEEKAMEPLWKVIVLERN